MSDYELCEPFGVDDGELEGIPPHVCFVLGAEWQLVYQNIQCSAATSRPIHAENIDRLVALCKRHNRKCVLRPLDESGWYQLDIEAHP